MCFQFEYKKFDCQRFIILHSNEEANQPCSRAHLSLRELAAIETSGLATYLDTEQEQKEQTAPIAVIALIALFLELSEKIQTTNGLSRLCVSMQCCNCIVIKYRTQRVRTTTTQYFSGAL